MSHEPDPRQAEAVRLVSERLAARRGGHGLGTPRPTPRGVKRLLLIWLLAVLQLVGLVFFALGVAGVVGLFGDDAFQRLVDAGFAVAAVVIAIGLRVPLGRLTAGTAPTRRRRR